MVDWKILEKLKQNTFTKMPDGTYDVDLVRIKYEDRGDYRIPTVELHFRTDKGIFRKYVPLMDRRGWINNTNKSKMDRIYKIVTGEYPNYKNFQDFSKSFADCLLEPIPLLITLFTPRGSLVQEFRIEEV